MRLRIATILPSLTDVPSKYVNQRPGSDPGRGFTYEWVNEQLGSDPGKGTDGV